MVDGDDYCICYKVGGDFISLLSYKGGGNVLISYYDYYLAYCWGSYLIFYGGSC